MDYEIIKTVKNQIRYSWNIELNRPDNWNSMSNEEKCLWIEANGTKNAIPDQFISTKIISYDDVCDVEYL